MDKHCVIFICLLFCLCIGCNQEKDDNNVAPPKDEKQNEDNVKPTNEGDTKVSFETISEGSNSGHEEKKEYVITNEKDWKELWDKVHATVEPKPELPKIDFTKEMVLAVFKGQQTTGGHSIKVNDIQNTNQGWDVKVKETSPEPGGMSMMVMTQPYHIVKTKKTAKKVMFKKD